MDELVASAVAHWGPRFTVNGVTRPTSRGSRRVEHWADWCAAWVAVGEQHEQLGREALAEGRLRSAGEHLAQAAVYYHFAKFVFVEDLDQMGARTRARRVPRRRPPAPRPTGSPGRDPVRERPGSWPCSGCPPAEVRSRSC